MRLVLPTLVAAACLMSGQAAQAQLALATTQKAPRSLVGIRFHMVADGPVRGGFNLAGNRLLFGTETGSAYAISSADGHILWKTALSSPILSTPAVSGDTAYFASWDNSLHAVDARSGRELWKHSLGPTKGPNDYWEYYVSSPIVSGGRLYVGSGSGKLFAFDLASRRAIWVADAGARIRTTPVIDGDIILVGSMAGEVLAFGKADGKRKWTFATQGAAHDFSLKENDTRSVVTAPIAVGNVVIAGGRDGNIYGIDANSGRELWNETHDGGSWILGLSGDRDAFFSGSGSAFIVQAADTKTGREIWRTPTGNAMFGGLAKAGDTIVSNGINGALFAFDSHSGAELWRMKLPDMTFSSPLVAPGVVFTGSDDGSVFAIDTSSAPGPQLDHFVYSYTNEPIGSFYWFKPDVAGSIVGGFANAAYKKIGTKELASDLESGRTARGRKVIVIADMRLPDAMDGKELRHFLDDGGVLVLVGPNPVGLQFDPDGAPVADDPDKAAAVFSLAPSDKQRDYGYNVSKFVPRARALGLEGQFVTVGWTRPDQVSLVLASDRSGMATAWVKRFANGGLLINLPLPRNRPVDLSVYTRAIDLIAGRNGS